jgi:hypothetical protein
LGRAIKTNLLFLNILLSGNLLDKSTVKSVDLGSRTIVVDPVYIDQAKKKNFNIFHSIKLCSKAFKEYSGRKYGNVNFGKDTS